MPEIVNLVVKLNPRRLRMAKSMYRLFNIIANADAKLYNRNPPKAFRPVFPTDDVALMNAITTVKIQLEKAIFPG